MKQLVRLVTLAVVFVIIILDCPTLESPDRLWSDCISGHLDKNAKRYLVTAEMKKRPNRETVCLKTTITKENYLNCRKALMELSSTSSGNSRMASGPAAFASKQENINYARLCRLLVDVGCTVLRDTFDSIHPPANLHVVLSSPSVFSILQSLRKKKVLNPSQWGNLFPAVASCVSSANFDVTLLIVLLRNICGLSPPVSTGSWEKLPPDSDNNLNKISTWVGKRQKTNNELEEMKENQERTNIELGEVKEMVKQLQPCERSTKESLIDEQVSDPFDLVKYISIIRQLYEDREGWLAPFPWCEEFRLNLDNIFTRLKFVSRKKERGIKTDVIVDLFEIFQRHQECSQPKRVLIEGQPGMGKTTYCQKIAYDWAKKRKGGESFPDVTLLLLLKCRDINCGLWEAIDDQLLPREVNEEEKERFFTFVRDHQSKVLLVLDGLDELPRNQLSTYTDIIQGRFLPESYIVVTARHEVGVKIRECCHTLLEVEGFTETDAKKFILRYFKEKHLAKKLLHKLDTDVTLQDLTRNPLNTALLCLLCEDFGGKFPESRTLLYLEIVECVLRRYRRKMKLLETKQDLLVLYKVELKQLGFIAMEGLHNDSMYFGESAFEGFSSDLKSGLGFLSVEAGRSKRRPSRSYGFLHKSFQEFFAALFQCCQLLDGEIFVDSLIADCRYFKEFQQVLLFTIGMLAQKCKAAVKAFIAGIATQVNLDDCRLDVALACVNECKTEGNTFDKEMAQFFGSHLKLQRAFCTGFTNELIAVCFETMKANSTVKELLFEFYSIHDASVDALAKGLKEKSTLTSLDLSCNQIGDVGKYVVNALNFAHEQGQLSNSQKQAMITLLEKKDKDRRFIKNWRPISLINVDVKIASKAIARRLELILPHIINPNQNGFIKGRSILDGVRTIEDLLEWAKLTDSSGILLAVDFQKAFDFLDHSFLIKVLERFNFGPYFLQWVKTFYTNVSSCVLNNGFTTDIFPV
ncbi:PREDICTED: uncharacterized protein LOC107347651 [Acropora digitifera]|uniref:uncharacterized protein LOC107347651 n=1 Tax=Acropora digitifera TaxID=70779 RepID=UPI00077AFF95|nr:PREDICTED: uncharacterized protein LOC107347651 [Acropora digitifera]